MDSFTLINGPLRDTKSGQLESIHMENPLLQVTTDNNLTNLVKEIELGLIL